MKGTRVLFGCLLLKYPVLWNMRSFKYQSPVVAGRLVTAGAPGPVRLQHAGVLSCFSLASVTDEPNNWEFVPHKNVFFSANDAVLLFFFFKERPLIYRLTRDEECFKTLPAEIMLYGHVFIIILEKTCFFPPETETET